MTVRAKFRCDGVTHLVTYLWDEQAKQSMPVPARTVVFSPVYGQGDPNHENTKFWNATPGGRIEMSVVNASAAEAFEPGREYYVDFTQAEG